LNELVETRQETIIYEWLSHGAASTNEAGRPRGISRKPGAGMGWRRHLSRAAPHFEQYFGSENGF
jgi:hypothetical protein